MLPKHVHDALGSTKAGFFFMATDAVLSRNNQLVLDTLHAARGPLSAYDLLDQLRDEGLRAPPQIYRALKWLTAAGLVHKLESANAYIACAHAKCCGGQRCASSQTVFLMCDSCGKVDEVAGSAIAGELDALLNKEDFTIRRASLEVHGTCNACAT